MGKPNSRRIALDCLRAWEAARPRRHADAILDELGRRHHLTGPDRALTQSLFYGVLRNLTRLDALIDELRHGKVNPEIRRVLRLGLFQLFDTEIPEHAAVNETVAMSQGMRGVVNGILRNAQRKRPELEKLASGWPLSVSESHPQFLIDRWTAQFGTDAAKRLCQWNNQPPSVFVRVNRLVEDAETTVQSSDRTAKVKGRPGFYRIVEGGAPAGNRSSAACPDPCLEHFFIDENSTALTADEVAIGDELLIGGNDGVT